MPLDLFIQSIEASPPTRVDGTAVFLTSTPDRVPHALLHNLKHNKVLHERVVFLTIVTRDIPYVPDEERGEVETLGCNFYRISADYAGFAQEYVQTHLPGAQAMFVQGFAGDSNPYPRGTLELARRHGETLGEEVLRVLDTKLRPVHGPLNLQFGYVDIPLASVPPRAELQQMTEGGSPLWRAWTASRMLEALDKGRTLPTHYRAPVAVWQFGDDLTWVALSGEVVADYVPLIEKAIGPLQLWLSAYSNDYFGYVPSARMLAEGGYETLGLFRANGIFTPEVEPALVEKVRELAARAGRKLP